MSKFKFVFAGSIAAALLMGSSNASVIVDPLNVGNDELVLFPAGGGIGTRLTQADIVASPDFGGEIFSIGSVSTPATGDLEVNSQLSPNTVTQLTNIGQLNLNLGALRIIGGGPDSAPFARVEVVGNASLGLGGNSELIISNGGQLDVDGTLSAQGMTGSVTTIQVEEFARLNAGRFSLGAVNSIDFTVNNGGLVLADETLSSIGFFVVGSTNSNDAGTTRVVNVDGPGSEIEFDGLFIAQGNNGATTINVTNGGAISERLIGGSAGIVIRGTNVASQILVDGAGSLLSTSGNIQIGEDSFSMPNADGELILTNGATASAGNLVFVDGDASIVSVSSGSTLTAPMILLNEGGTLSGDGGTIVGDVIVDGGTVAPGASPGTLNIDGDLDFRNINSLLEIEFESADVFDILNVSGDLIATDGFTLELSFLNGFTPQDGDTFSFLNIAGATLVDLSMINIIATGLSDEFDFALNALDGVFSITASASDLSEIPLPGALLFMLTGLVGFGSVRHRKKQNALGNY